MSITSGIVASVNEAHELIADGLLFPVLIIPVSEKYEGMCYVVQNTEYLEGAVEKALDGSRYCNPPKAHVISRDGFDEYWMKYWEFELIYT